ncbi:WxcM-like domain-containing protein [Riemerella anatipestifer]|uniref:WxcM-like domain-containing protein n=1 Tax=Riemerella anatipestifer TaxID=34085 RepID=UPI000D689006|nr:WxcM-like domain-containing protein [Riemerella anatipestifer]MDY3389964.1 WxcM-like domain-containing protein [Riemerella anatipestifer]MDY3517946.1 WxcM-like domain-containing protein [Riemerella anatipestifer]MDY3542932.1 WxcM-like domain-containing protein [Riemerella anatipestifer]MRM84753.1 sugar epimerase [Riemerella anatipestifer]WJR88252.1 hypothetical protein CCUG25010_00012 [Riemerella anatipestifer]
MIKPVVIQGGRHTDERGSVTFNNNFDASQVKRVYTLENVDTNFIRGWQGHRIEQRWMMPVSGAFEVRCIAVDDWENPSPNLVIQTFQIASEKLEVLHVPSGYITAIQSRVPNAKMVLMSDYYMGEIQDEIRFPLNYFKQER